jgi:hypothetical protein
MRFSWLLAALLAPAGCGARTPLNVYDGDAAPDAPGHPSTLPCGAVAAPGTVVWQTATGSDATFTGPWAADESGTTYFLGVISSPGGSPLGYQVAALDSCGRLRWASSPTALEPLNGARPGLLLAGDRVVVEWSAVDAFDRKSGAHLWNVDLNAIAGTNLAFDSFAEIAPPAAAADGTTLVAFEWSGGGDIVSIDAGGSASKLASFDPAGDLISLIVDGAGQIDILLNTALSGALVDSYSRDGSRVFESSFSCSAMSLGPMASGNAFLAMQTGPCILTLSGQPGFSPSAGTGDYRQMVIDAENNLYVADDASDLFSFDTGGRVRWTATSKLPSIGGPVLGADNRVFVARADLSSGWDLVSSVTFVAVDAASGSAAAPWVVSTRLPPAALIGFPFLLTAAEQLVFAGNGNVTALAAGVEPAAKAQWPTATGGTDGRQAALGR